MRNMRLARISSFGFVLTFILILQSCSTKPTLQTASPPSAVYQHGDELVRLLDSANTKARERATDNLIEMGQDALVPIIHARLEEETLSLEKEARISIVLSGIAERLPWPFDAKEAVKRQDETATALGVDKIITLDLGNKVTMKLILIPPGRFIMGSPADEKDRQKCEGPEHAVIISKAFYMGIYTVTQEQYEQVMGKNPSAHKGSQCPVEVVSWDDAVDFCNLVSHNSDKMVRLPTEAEWEYACRAGSSTRFHYGEDGVYANLGDYAWYDENAWQAGEKHAHPVGQKIPNQWGLYDMHGNIYQWCADLYLDGYYADAMRIDPVGPKTGNGRVMRGGDYYHWGWLCRSASRNYNGPAARCGGFGLRVVVNAK